MDPKLLHDVWTADMPVDKAKMLFKQRHGYEPQEFFYYNRCLYVGPVWKEGQNVQGDGVPVSAGDAAD